MNSTNRKSNSTQNDKDSTPISAHNVFREGKCEHALKEKASNDLYFLRDDGFLTKSFYNENDADAINFNDYDNYEYYAVDLVKKEMEELKSFKTLSSVKELLKESELKQGSEICTNSILYDSQSELSTNLSKLDANSRNMSLDDESSSHNFTTNSNYSSLLIRNQYSIQHTLDDNRYNHQSLN